MAGKAGTGEGASPPGARLYGMYVGSLVVCLVGNLLIRMGDEAGWLAWWGKVLLGVLSAAPLMAAAVLFWRLLRRDLDEMLQRIVLEGLAFALVVYVPLAAFYINLRTAVPAFVPHLDAPDILLTPAILAAIGFALARRRFE
jgi:hypothetical protein